METNELIILATVILIGLLILTSLIGLIFYWKLKRFLKDLEFQKNENEKRRTFETGQSTLNHEYRLKALEFDNLKQVVQALSEKHEANKKNPEEKVTRYKIDHNLLVDILKVKEELDKTK